MSTGSRRLVDLAASILLTSSQLSPDDRSLLTSPGLPQIIAPITDALLLVEPEEHAGTLDILHLSSLKNVRATLLQYDVCLACSIPKPPSGKGSLTVFDFMSMRGSFCNHIPSEVFAKRGVLKVVDDNASSHDKVTVGLWTGAGAGESGGGTGACDGGDGIVGDGGSEDVGGTLGSSLRQNKPRNIYLSSGRQNKPPKKLNGAVADRSDLDDGWITDGVIVSLNMYSGFLDEVDFHKGFCPRAGIKPFSEFAGMYPSGKSTIKSALFKVRQLFLTFALNKPRRISSSEEQNWYVPPSTIVSVVLIRRS